MNWSHLALAIFVAVAPCAFAADGDDLTGTTWRLVEVRSMDDSVLVPEDASRYTLEFTSDGRAVLQADCNTGTASWTSESDSDLRFGPIASTRAACLPGSLSEGYLSQFEWVRSYVMKSGHLFLTTMADGSIIEFEPTDGAEAVATVLGEDLSTTDAAEMQQTILGLLFDQYAADQGITAEPAEIAAFLDGLRRGRAEAGSTAEDDLTPQEVAEVEAMENAMAESLIRQWKINKALYDRYGGRIIYQQFGPEPLDAYRQFLQQRESEGAFAIHEQATEDAFWDYFTNELIHDFMAPNSAEFSEGIRRASMGAETMTNSAARSNDG